MKVKIYDNWTIDPDQSRPDLPSEVQEPPCWARDNIAVAGRGEEGGGHRGCGKGHPKEV